MFATQWTLKSVIIFWSKLKLSYKWAALINWPNAKHAHYNTTILWNYSVLYLIQNSAQSILSYNHAKYMTSWWYCMLKVLFSHLSSSVKMYKVWQLHIPPETALFFLLSDNNQQFCNINDLPQLTYPSTGITTKTAIFRCSGSIKTSPRM
jgi:hypothetical protein